MRPEDVAFALNECGLLTKRLRIQANSDDGGRVGADTVVEEWDHMIVIEREAVEKVAAERNVKRMCMDLACVKL
jgi:hypothetical protein